MTDYKILLIVVVFIGSFVYVQGMFNTEFVTSNFAENYTVYWNGTAYTNLTAQENQVGAIPMPPQCNWGGFVIDGVVGCVGGYVGYYYDIMTFNTEIAWLNILIITPLLIVFGFFVLMLLIELARVIAEAIPL